MSEVTSRRPGGFDSMKPWSRRGGGGEHLNQEDEDEDGDAEGEKEEQQQHLLQHLISHWVPLSEG